MMYQKSSNYIAKVPSLDATILEVPYKVLIYKFIKIIGTATKDPEDKRSRTQKIPFLVL